MINFRKSVRFPVLVVTHTQKKEIYTHIGGTDYEYVQRITIHKFAYQLILIRDDIHLDLVQSQENAVIYFLRRYST